MVTASTRTLFVFAHINGGFVPAGQLGMTEQGIQLLASEFAYGQRYLDRAEAFEIDPVGLSLRDKDAVRARLLAPPNGLPFFGGIRDAAPDAWGRRVIEARLKTPANSLPESTYLLEAGGERMGALDVRESLTAPVRASRGSIHSLTYLMEAAERIEAGLDIPEHLAAIFATGSGMGGMRPKVSVRDDSGRLWLAKFASRHDHLLDVPMIECATLKLAQLAGFSVPDTRLIQVRDSNVLLISRFDRAWQAAEKPVEMRLPMVSALTMLACDEMDSPNKSYADIVDAMRRYNAAAHIKADIEELYGRMIFNILVSNDDDHLRNHAFIRDASLRDWRLSPLYDVVPRASLASERYLHLGVGVNGRLANLDNAYTAKERFGLSGPDALRIMGNIWKVVRQWKSHFESFGVPTGQINRIAPAFRHINDISGAELRKQLKKL
ncbi:MAG: HipA domain-containing protein [Burkholderiaceae bacterium]|jgi:serine/threonine-protein kinase HipA|nr:HipA domain-containing protein [Burkholderiaceae bacterium]